MIATNLAEKMNISNVLSTDMVELVLKNCPSQKGNKLFEKSQIKNFEKIDQMLEYYKEYC